MLCVYIYFYMHMQIHSMLAWQGRNFLLFIYVFKCVEQAWFTVGTQVYVHHVKT